MVDSLRKYVLPPVREKWERTFIDDLVEKGVFFEQCVTAGAYTMASLSAKMTSFYPALNGIDGWFKNLPYDLDKNVITFADMLKSAGYFNAGFFPNPIKAVVPPYSFDHFQMIKNPARYSVEKYISAPSPKFAFFYFLEIHDACCKNAGTFDSVKYIESVKEEAECVRYFYEKCAGPQDIIILTSDHGVRIIDEPTSEVHRDEKVSGKFLTDKTTRTFFALIYKEKLPPSTIVREQVRTIDIAPTVLDLAGLPLMGGQGVSLLPYLQGKEKWPEHPAFMVTGGSETSPWKPDMWGVRTPQWKFVLTKKEKFFLKREYRQELYNLKEDPAELVNVADRFPEVTRLFLAEVKENLLQGVLSVKDYYEKHNFDYHKYLKTRTFSLWLRLELFLRTLFLFKLLVRTKVQLGVRRMKIRKSLIKKFGRSII